MPRLRFAVFALVAAAVSCGDATGPRPIELAIARRRWQAQHLRTYAFTLQRDCFCVATGPLYVAVLDDTVGGVTDLATGESVDRRLGETVDDLFDFIEQAIDRHAAVIRVRYDVARGFPTEIQYDGSTAAADDEIEFHASDVHPIAPPAGTLRVDPRRLP